MASSDDKYAIHAACREGQTNKVEALLNANPKLTKLRDPDDRLPIHWATSHARLPILTLLSDLPGFDPDPTDSAGWTPLLIAASHPDGTAAARLLLAKGADTNATATSGATALHLACSKANLDTVRLLLDAKASARVRDRRGQAPLHRASAVGATVIMGELIGRGRSAVDGADVDGMTALHHAVAEGHGDAAVVLLKAGAAVDRKDATGALAIDLAPDAKVREYIMRAAEEEGISLG